MRRVVIAVVLLVAAPAWGGGRVAVMTTTTDLKSLVEAVGGDRVAVEGLAPAAQDPHAIEIKPGQLTRLKSADLLVRIGLDHEPWLWPALRALGDARLRPGSPHYLDIASSVQLLQTELPRVKNERGVHLHAFGNTHYWLDPENARPITAVIVQALATLAPPDRFVFDANRAAFLARLDAALARWARMMAPYRGTRMVVVHDSWPYFARRFGLVTVAAIEPTPGVPPSPSSIANLTHRMRETGVTLVVAEPYSNSSLVSQVAARSGARVVTLVTSVGGDPEARDYIALFDLDVRRLTAALGGAR